MAVISWPDDINIMQQRLQCLPLSQRSIPSDNGVDQIVNRADPQWVIQTELHGTGPKLKVDRTIDPGGAYTGAVEDLFNRLEGAKNHVDLPIKRPTLPIGRWTIASVTIDDDLSVVISGVNSETNMPKHKHFLKLVPADATKSAPRVFRVAADPVFDVASKEYTMILQPRILGGILSGDELLATDVIRVRRVMNVSEVWGNRNADFYDGGTTFWREVIEYE